MLVVQEIFGVHEHIRDICRRLALEGYLAVAPELYFREGDPNDYNDIPTLFKELVSKVARQPGAGRSRSRGELGCP
ncbi:dienelactone hydrolase family protein [Pantoea ananatis]